MVEKQDSESTKQYYLRAVTEAMGLSRKVSQAKGFNGSVCRSEGADLRVQMSRVMDGRRVVGM